jgi:hypothetical protein
MVDAKFLAASSHVLARPWTKEQGTQNIFESLKNARI